MKNELVLIADDSEEVLYFTAFAVENFGYNTAKAINGKEAFEKSLQLKPDIIVLDYLMPVMDGLEATKNLRAHKLTKEIPIIMITASDNVSNLIMEAMELGVNDFIRKPFERSELHARIKSLLKQAKYYKEIIEMKNNEINNSALKLAHSIEEKALIKTKLDAINDRTSDIQSKKIIEELIAKIKIADILNPFDKIKNQFLKVHTSFLENLLEKHPHLTKAEIKLCVLLRINLSTKEIAALLYQSYDSVRVSRTRLREKLKLNNSNKLHNYLMQF